MEIVRVPEAHELAPEDTGEAGGAHSATARGRPVAGRVKVCARCRQALTGRTELSVPIRDG